MTLKEQSSTMTNRLGKYILLCVFEGLWPAADDDGDGDDGEWLVRVSLDSVTGDDAICSSREVQGTVEICLF